MIRDTTVKTLLSVSHMIPDFINMAIVSQLFHLNRKYLGCLFCLGTTVKVVIYSVVLLSILSFSQRWLHSASLSYYVCYAFLLDAKFLKITVMQHQFLCVCLFFLCFVDHASWYIHTI